MDKIDYEFVELPESDPFQNTPIKIKNGKYSGIIFKFGKISLNEEGENLNVNMEIDMVQSPDNFDQNEREFTNTVGEIFTQIVETGVEIKNNDPVDLEDDVHQD